VPECFTLIPAGTAAATAFTVTQAKVRYTNCLCFDKPLDTDSAPVQRRHGRRAG